MRVALIGFGTVAQGLVEILQAKHDDLRDRYDFEPTIVAVTTRSRGSLFCPDGLNPQKLLVAIEQGNLENYPEQPKLMRGWDSLQTIQNGNADVVVEASYSNLETGQPAIDHVCTALKLQKHVVMANKGPVALAYAELQETARNTGVQLRFEGSVMAGTPALLLAMEGLKGCTILEAQGILNGTTNYMLTRMEEGLTYEQAFAEADELGYLEADPSIDVGGWDSAGKALILANVLFGQQLQFSDLIVEGITGITAQDIQSAMEHQERWKLIVQVTPNGGSVRPIRLPVSNPLANVKGGTNAITLRTDLMGDITLIGAGAGRRETGYALLMDLLSIHQSL